MADCHLSEMGENMMNRIIALMGASGSGKSTLGRALEETGLQQLVSFTTRKPRPGEVDGKDYHFIERKDIPWGDLVEHTEYAGNFYGLTKKEVHDKLSESDVYFICDRHGCELLRAAYPATVAPIWLEIKVSSMVERMKARGDDFHKILERVVHAVETEELTAPEFPHYTLSGKAETSDQVTFIRQVVLRKEAGETEC